jgi:hypothetical protein
MKTPGSYEKFTSKSDFLSKRCAAFQDMSLFVKNTSGMYGKCHGNV